jgi:hypothetical protein
MPFTNEQARIMQRHLERRNLRCPVCSEKEWQLVEVASLPVQSAASSWPGQYLEPLGGKLGGPPFLAPLGRLGSSGKSGSPGRSETSGGGGFTTLSNTSVLEKVFPVAVVVCTCCFYVMQFAWKPIAEGVRGRR